MTRAMATNPSEDITRALEARVRDLRGAVNAETLDRTKLRLLVAALDETLQRHQAHWDEVHQDLIDNQTSHFFLAQQFTAQDPFQ